MASIVWRALLFRLSSTTTLFFHRYFPRHLVPLVSSGKSRMRRFSATCSFVHRYFETEKKLSTEAPQGSSFEFWGTCRPLPEASDTRCVKRELNASGSPPAFIPHPASDRYTNDEENVGHACRRGFAATASSSRQPLTWDEATYFHVEATETMSSAIVSARPVSTLSVPDAVSSASRALSTAAAPHPSARSRAAIAMPRRRATCASTALGVPGDLHSHRTRARKTRKVRWQTSYQELIMPNITRARYVQSHVCLGMYW